MTKTKYSAGVLILSAVWGALLLVGGLAMTRLLLAESVMRYAPMAIIGGGVAFLISGVLFYWNVRGSHVLSIGISLACVLVLNFARLNQAWFGTLICAFIIVFVLLHRRKQKNEVV